MHDPKKKKPKLCMFCGKDKAEGQMTREHFVPRCLWAGERPKHTKTLPAHLKCNAAFAEDNDYFRTVLTYEEGAENHPEARRVIEGPLRTLIMDRPRQFDRLTKDLQLRPRFTESGIYLGKQYAFTIDTDRMVRVLKNIVKGIFYTMRGRPLSTTAEITIWSLDRELNPGLRHGIEEKMSEWMGFGDTVFACKHLFYPWDPEGMDCVMSFYGRKHFMGAAKSVPAGDVKPPVHEEV